jgi:alpha-ribazole phosphatase/probable phosphoglycerate mutase
MRQLLLVRHAETDLKGTFCGHTDPSLNEAGRSQLQSIVQGIADAHVKLVISSDLRRAQETAAPIARKFQVDHLLRPGLREIYFGEWEGLSWQQIETRDPDLARRWHHDFPRVAIPGGELLEDFEARVARELDYLRTLPDEGATVVVAHGGVLRTMIEAGGNNSPQQVSYGEIIRYSL